jgi:thioredoxin reductase/ferredoxin
MLRAMTSFAATLFGPKRIEPSYPKLPLVDADGRASIDGIYVVGDAAGTPLLKLGMNAGAKTADAIAADLGATSTARARPPEPRTTFDVVVVGAGAAGLACALRLRKRGLSVVVVDGNALAQTVVSMTKGKHIFAEPTNIKNESDLWLDECTREQLLERWQRDVSEAGVEVRERCRVDDVRRDGADLAVKLASGDELRARRVVVAVGKSGSPRKAGVPGEAEHAARIRHFLDDASLVKERNLLVYGGGDVACEAALALSEPALGNKVTMATIDRALTFPKKRNRDAIERASAEGRVSLRLDTKLGAIDATSCRLQGGAGASVSEGAAVVDADLVYIMIGADPPVAFFRKLGLALDGDWTVRRYLVAALVFLGVYSLYALKKFPETPFSWPFTLFIDEASFRDVVGRVFDVAFAPFAWLFDANARADIESTTWFQQGYLYSLLYTMVMLVFGWRALMRWRGVAKRPRYQTYRYLTLLAFQLVFFLVANVVAVQALSVQNSWRAWGLYQPWPLFFNTFHWWQSSDPRVVELLFIGGGLIGTFVAIPLLAWKNGKRFCTWVCGCGGLAETLGDRWRHLSPKGTRSRAWEFQSFVVLGAATLATVVTVGAYQTRADNIWAQAYSYIVDFWLVAVIPVALYPFFGGKVWCRYWCPLAAWNQLLARWYGRLGIASNDHCISCGQCSKHCEVGVDVMQFARSQERFDNRNSGCIQCGICIDVCPVDVLSFDVRRPGELRVLS